MKIVGSQFTDFGQGFERQTLYEIIQQFVKIRLSLLDGDALSKFTYNMHK